MINPHNRLYSSRSRGTVRSRSLGRQDSWPDIGCGCLLTPILFILALIIRIGIPLAIIAGSVYIILYLLRSFGLV